jgi:hypothetical protein
MAAPFVPVAVKQFPRLVHRVTADERYWSQLQVWRMWCGVWRCGKLGGFAAWLPPPIQSLKRWGSLRTKVRTDVGPNS